MLLVVIAMMVVVLLSCVLNEDGGQVVCNEMRVIADLN